MRELPGGQNSDRWLKNRVGRITGSRMGDVMSTLARKSKSGDAGEPGAAYHTYRRELIVERLTGRAANKFVTSYMEDGAQREDEAKSMYELASQKMVVPVGFVLHPKFDWMGASPDGLCGDCCLEVKSPKAETLWEWIETDEIPREYILQMQAEMLCCELGECDFYGWFPGMPHFFKTVARDEALISWMEARAEALHLDVEASLAKIGRPPTVWTEESEAKFGDAKLTDEEWIEKFASEEIAP